MGGSDVWSQCRSQPLAPFSRPDVSGTKERHRHSLEVAGCQRHPRV